MRSGLQRRHPLSGLLAVATGLLVINLGYATVLPLHTLGSYAFETSALARLQSVLPGWLPIPLPYHLVHGTDLQMHQGAYDAYLLGEINKAGFWNYFLVGLLVKTPEPILLLALAAAACWRRVGLREIPALVVGLGCFAFISFVSRKNLGIRYILFVLP